MFFHILQNLTLLRAGRRRQFSPFLFFFVNTPKTTKQFCFKLQFIFTQFLKILA